MTRKPLLSAAMALALAAPIASPVMAQQTLNVRDADIRAFIQDAARVTGRAFIIDHSVSGKVSGVTDRPLARSALLEIFLSSLRAEGLGAVAASGADCGRQPADGGEGTARGDMT